MVEIPLLEWVENDSELEHFTIVQSRKKKKKSRKLENPTKEVQVRRSKRCTPSVYREKGG